MDSNSCGGTVKVASQMTSMEPSAWRALRSLARVSFSQPTWSKLLKECLTLLRGTCSPLLLIR